MSSKHLNDARSSVYGMLKIQMLTMGTLWNSVEKLPKLYRYACTMQMHLSLTNKRNEQICITTMSIRKYYLEIEDDNIIDRWRLIFFLVVPLTYWYVFFT